MHLARFKCRVHGVIFHYNLGSAASGHNPCTLCKSEARETLHESRIADGRYEFVEYVSKSKAKYRCSIHGQEFEYDHHAMEQNVARAGSEYSSSKCTECGGKKFNNHDVDRWLAEHELPYSRVENYTTVFYPIRLRCTEHRLDFYATPMKLKFGKHQCPQCREDSNVPNNVAYTTESYQQRLDSMGVHYTLLETWGKGRLRHRCNTHGEEFECYPTRILHDKTLPCPVCTHVRKSASQYRVKTDVIDGVECRTQGYEALAIRWILENKCVKLSDLRLSLDHPDDVPLIWYELFGKSHRYHPDIFVPMHKLVIEVKSRYTLVQNLDKNRAKAVATINSGYRYVVLCMDAPNPQLPKDWHLLSTRNLRGFLA